MVMMKLAQTSSNEMNDLMQRHFDVDMKIRDILTTASLSAKTELLGKLPQILADIDSQQKALSAGA